VLVRGGHRESLASHGKVGRNLIGTVPAYALMFGHSATFVCDIDTTETCPKSGRTAVTPLMAGRVCSATLRFLAMDPQYPFWPYRTLLGAWPTHSPMRDSMILATSSTPAELGEKERETVVFRQGELCIFASPIPPGSRVGG
jgi:hypothetical protein